MKYDDIIPQNQPPEVLDEVKMTTNVFDQFINSDAADGIQAGFEAELIFTGLGGSGGDYYDAEPEMDESEDRRPRSIEDIVEFFHDGDHNSRRDVDSLSETLQNEFFEWQSDQMNEAWSEAETEAVKEYIEENDFDYDDEVENYLRDELNLDPQQLKVALAAGKSAGQITSSKQLALFADENEAYAHWAEARDHVDELLDERVQESIDSQDRNYDRAREEWEDNVRDDYDDSDWLRDSEYSWMTDVYRNQDINWPYWNYPDAGSEGGYSEENAQRLADIMEDELDVNVKVASGYHSATRRPGLWIFEPDSSLEPDDGDDMPVEIISPPMPLRQTLEILPKFYDWAKTEGAYSNESTGFHIGVSLPDVGGRVDYVKLALFLGDQYVLDQFDRGANYFAKSSMEKLRQDVKTGTVSADKVKTTLLTMKNGLIEVADSVIKRGGGAHGKYSSINVKGDYIEFRSMGSESYFSNPGSLNKVLDTIKRYAYAMYIASRPELFRDEYAKKLYKLLDKEGNGAAAMKDFADYVASVGGVDQQTVKNLITSLKSETYSDAPLPDRRNPVRTGRRDGQPSMYWWKVDAGNRKLEVLAQNKGEARAMAAKQWNVPVPELGLWSASQITDPIILGRLNNRPTIDLDL